MYIYVRTFAIQFVHKLHEILPGNKVVRCHLLGFFDDSLWLQSLSHQTQKEV